MNKKILSLILICSLGAQQAQAITKMGIVAAATLLTAASGGGAFVFSKVVDWMKHDCQDICTNNTCAGIAALSVGAPTFVGSTWILSYYTPNARCKWVSKKFRYLEDQYLYHVVIHASNIESILQNSGCESTEFPLVTAFLEFQSYDNLLVSMAKNIEVALDDTSSKSLQKRLRKQHERVQIALDRIRKNESMIKNHNQSLWLEQWKQYQRQEQERKRLELERQKMINNMMHTTHVIFH